MQTRRFRTRHGVSNLVGRALPYLATIPLGGPEAAVVGRLPQGAGIAARVAARALLRLLKAQPTARLGKSARARVGPRTRAGCSGGCWRAGACWRGWQGAGPGKPFLSDSARRTAALAEKYGVPLSPADLTNSPLLRRLANLPGSGRVALAEKQSAAVNREIANTIGVDAPRVDSQIYAAKKVADSRLFNELTARNNLAVTARPCALAEGDSGRCERGGWGTQRRR